MRAAIGAAGKALQWSPVSAAAVPAKAFDADGGGGMTDADAGDDTASATADDAGGGPTEAGDDTTPEAGDETTPEAGDDTTTTPEESAALRP